MQETAGPSDSAPICANCGAALGGEYCAHCGERCLRPGEHTLRHIVGEWFEAFSHGEGRLLVSLRTLLLKPGELTREYFRGRRMPYARPVALFFAVNLLYFLLSTNITFNTPLFLQLTMSPLVQAKQAIMAERVLGTKLVPAERATSVDEYLQLEMAALAQTRQSGRWLTENELLQRIPPGDRAAAVQALLRFEQRYDERTDELSRALVIAFVPMLTACLWLALVPLRRKLPELTIFATHMCSGLLLLLLLVGWALQLMAYAAAFLLGHLPTSLQSDNTLTAIVGLVVMVYVYLCVRGYFRFPRLGCAALCAWMLAGLFWSLELYRVLLFFVTVYALR